MASDREDRVAALMETNTLVFTGSQHYSANMGEGVRFVVVFLFICLTNCTTFTQQMKQIGRFQMFINRVTECRLGKRKAVSVIW